MANNNINFYFIYLFIFYYFTDPTLDGNQRISILQQRLTDIRKTYNTVKSELATIERRRKKLKRREREGQFQLPLLTKYRN